MITKVTLVRLSAYAAIAGGGLRVLASFTPPSPGDPLLELLYLLIDLFLLFGLIGIYLGRCERAGVMALSGWILAMIGLAVIAGPEGSAFGLDIYYVGAMAVLAGLSVYSLSLVRHGVRLNYAPWMWLASLGAAILSGVPAFAVIGLIASGVLFGAGFVAAGLALKLSGTPHGSWQGYALYALMPIAVLAALFGFQHINKEAPGFLQALGAGTAASVVAEHVVALEVARSMREKFGGDALADMKASYEHYLGAIRARMNTARG